MINYICKSCGKHKRISLSNDLDLTKGFNIMCPSCSDAVTFQNLADLKDSMGALKYQPHVVSSTHEGGY